MIKYFILAVANCMGTLFNEVERKQNSFIADYWSLIMVATHIYHLHVLPLAQEKKSYSSVLRRKKTLKYILPTAAVLTLWNSYKLLVKCLFLPQTKTVTGYREKRKCSVHEGFYFHFQCL